MYVVDYLNLRSILTFDKLLLSLHLKLSWHTGENVI